MLPILREEKMYAMDYGDESDDKPMSIEVLKDILDVSQYHLNLNMREACNKICDRIKQEQSEWEGELAALQNMGKVLHKGFKYVVTDILQDLPPLGESGSEVSHFIPEPRCFYELNFFQMIKINPG